jgi:hypothetical protein
MLKKIFDVIKKMSINLRLFDSLTLILFSRITVINNNFWGNEVIEKHLKTVLDCQNEVQKQLLQKPAIENKTD